MHDPITMEEWFLSAVGSDRWEDVRDLVNLDAADLELKKNLRKLLRRIEKGLEISLNEDADPDKTILIVSRVEFEGATYVVARFPGSPTPQLSDREREIVSLVAEGLQNKEIAQRLNIRVPTVAAHLQRIYRKMGVNTRTSLAQRVMVMS